MRTNRKPMLIFVGDNLKKFLWVKSKGFGYIPSRVVWTLIEMFTLGTVDMFAFAEQYEKINSGVKDRKIERLLKSHHTPAKKKTS